MPEISREDAIWLAGLLEGEGTFDLHRKKYPRVRVGMSDRDVVGRAATLMGAQVRLSLKPYPNAAMFHAEVSGTKAVAVMEAVLQHMGARRSAKIATVLGWARLATDASGAPGPKISRPPATPMPA
ncbi:hypothetical protein [Promicromonospora kroppenstedtii]|uniref:hypothetical protein n=2 Tax=Promicromonospora kroppenstedtii TaxID=440482 RepID=UPI0004B3F5CD|nr:hypothetical protein [Promicromonospora kroppenstedtii]